MYCAAERRRQRAQGSQRRSRRRPPAEQSRNRLCLSTDLVGAHDGTPFLVSKRPKQSERGREMALSPGQGVPLSSSSLAELPSAKASKRCQDSGRGIYGPLKAYGRGRAFKLLNGPGGRSRKTAQEMQTQWRPANSSEAITLEKLAQSHATAGADGLFSSEKQRADCRSTRARCRQGLALAITHLPPVPGSRLLAPCVCVRGSAAPDPRMMGKRWGDFLHLLL
jgi:hypothetical protein